MKKIIFSFSLLLCLNCFSNEVLSYKQILLEELNTLCSVIWCEGEYVYKFKDFQCDQQNCKLFFSYKKDGESFQEKEGYCDLSLPKESFINERGFMKPGNIDTVSECLEKIQ